MPEEVDPEPVGVPLFGWEIRRLLERHGHANKLVADKSLEVARWIREFDPVLDGGHFSETWLSRACTGNRIKKPNKKKFLVLFLTLEYMDSRGRIFEDPEAALSKAKDFWDEKIFPVLDITTKADVEGNFDPFNQQHLRILNLFGSHGADLVRQASSENGKSVAEKLAILSFIEGYPDDADYWISISGLSGDAGVTIELATAVRTCLKYARQYLYAGEQSIAEIFFESAVRKGSVDAAYSLGELNETRENLVEAVRWFRTAYELGHLEANRRIKELGHTEGGVDL